MSRYSSYGTLDDRIGQDGDVGFVGFNNRLRPDQLKPGLLADSQNMRMDRSGQAQVRKGVDLVNAPLAVGTEAMTVPFFILDSEKTGGVASLSGGALLISFASPHSLATGSVGQLKLSGLSPVDFDGRYTVTVVDSTTIKLEDKTYSSTPTGNVTIDIPSLDDTAVNNIYGSTDFSDPADDSSQYIVIASNSKAVGIDLSSGLNFDIGYPPLKFCSNSVEMIQAFNKVFIFEGGVTALENELKISRISAASIDESESKVTVTTTSNHNLLTGDLITINGLGFDPEHPNPNGPGKSVVKINDTQFTYQLTTTEGDETYTVSSSSVLATDFKKVSSGKYTQPLRFELNDINYVEGIGTATAEATPVSTLKTGDVLTFVTTILGTSLDAQTLSINVTTLPGGSKQSHYKTTALGNDSFQYPADNLVLGLNTFNITAVDFSREVFFRFNNSGIGFDSLIYNGEELNPSGVATTVGTSGLFQTEGGGVGVNFPYKIGITIRGIQGESGTSGYQINETIAVRKVTSPTTFTFITDRADRTGLRGRVQKKVSVSLGFIHMPAPSFAALPPTSFNNAV